MGTSNTRSADEPPDEAEQVAVFRIDGILEGWIPRQESRVSDGLNAADWMRVQAAEGDGGPGQWLDLDLDQVVAVAVAPRPPSRARVSGRLHAVEIHAGPYRVNGTVHMPVGADPTRYVASSPRRWLPLTKCTVAAGNDEWAVDVVIVNLDHATRQRRADAPPAFG